MNYFQLATDPRDDQYGRLSAAVLGALREAVRYRLDRGETKASIAERIGCDRSQLSRALNGRVGNLTLRTISDILWAVEHEPEDFKAHPYEEISSNYVCRAPATIKANAAPANVTASAMPAGTVVVRTLEIA